MSSELTKQNAPDWIAWIADFDRALKIWKDSRDALISRKPWIAQYAPHMLAEHNAIIAKFNAQVPEINYWGNFRANLLNGLASIGVAIKGIGDVTGINAAVNWAKGIFGLNGYDVGLGVIAPTVKLVVGLGSAIALVVALSDVAKQGFSWVTRVDAFKMALEKGATPEQASAAVNAALGNPADGQFLGLPIREAIIAAVLIVLGPPIVRAISERRK